MKELLRQYAAYNLWANEKICEAIHELGPGQQHHEVISSFNTVYKTVLHIWGAEKLWWQRLQRTENIVAPADEFNQSMQALTAAWKQQDQQWFDAAEDMDNDLLKEVLTYRNKRGDEFNQPVFFIFQQVFNHATYHRGQLVTMLRQLGLEKIPNTDFIAWTWMPK